MTDSTDNEFYIRHGKEERFLEYKRAMIWTNEDTKVKIALAMMAMSNLRNGGVIVIGMQEISRGIWQPESLTVQQAASFTQDDIAQWVNDYAVPSVQFTVDPFILNAHKFVIIKVREFDTGPTICRKKKDINSGRELIKRGAIYYRSNSKNQSAPISSDEDMRELIRLAIDKGVSREIERLRALGCPLPSQSAPVGPADAYERERNGL